MQWHTDSCWPSPVTWRWPSLGSASLSPSWPCSCERRPSRWSAVLCGRSSRIWWRRNSWEQPMACERNYCTVLCDIVCVVNLEIFSGNFWKFAGTCDVYRRVVKVPWYYIGIYSTRNVGRDAAWGNNVEGNVAGNPHVQEWAKFLRSYWAGSYIPVIQHLISCGIHKSGNVW